MVNPETRIEPSAVPPLDPSVLRLSDTERAFLRAVISDDDEKFYERILDVQKRSYEKYPYPCIRAFHFVNLMMMLNDIYPTVLEAGKRGDTTLLDLGCCMGTDLRKLVYDGYPASRVIGCDLRPEYIQIGYELFGDADSCPIRFITSNVFDLDPSGGLSGEDATPLDLARVTDLAQLRGSLTHIYTGALFHLFDEGNQYGLAVRLARLLKRQPGAIVFGRHQGLENEGLVNDHLERNRYGHSPSSWERLWKSVFAEVEGESFAEKVVVRATLAEPYSKEIFKTDHAVRMLFWSVEIV